MSNPRDDRERGFQTALETERSSSRPRRDPVLFELQIHPQDIRKRVRYLFVTRRQLIAWGTFAALWLVLLASSALVLPRVLTKLIHLEERRSMIEERGRLTERLGELVGQLESLDGKSDALRLAIDQIFLLYGLPEDAAVGQGGYPFAEDPEPPTDDRPTERLRYARALESTIAESLAVSTAFLDEIQAFEAARADQVRLMPSISPLRGQEFVLTSPFGYRKNPFSRHRDFHAGLDLAAKRGTPIVAPADGRVVFAGRYSLQQSVAWWRYGKLVVLAHGDDFRTFYGHCDEVLVERGDQVVQGQEIGRVGNTGMSTNSHLHYEVRRRNGTSSELEPVDPRIYILDHRWRDEERILVESRVAPPATDFQPLPPLLAR